MSNVNNIVATVNVSSLVSKLNELKVIGQGIFNILMTNEAKLNATFSVAKFCINDFSTPYRMDRN